MHNKICPECGHLIRLWRSSNEKLPLFLHRHWSHKGWFGKAQLIFVWCLLGLSGILFILLGWISTRKIIIDELLAIKAKSWPTVTGSIIRTWINIEDNTTGYVDSPGFISYEPHTIYRYNIEGTTHESDCIRTYHVAYGLKKSAEKLLSKYPIGKSVTVHYNPGDKRQSILEPGFKFAMFLMKAFMSLLLFAVGVFWIILIFYLTTTL